MDFRPSERSKTLTDRVRAFVSEHVVPVEERLMAARRATRSSPDWRTWSVPPEVRELQARARAEGLWNLFLPDPEHGAGLSNVEYAPVAEEMGRSFLAPEVFNCNAPDTGNMEVLHKYGSPEQQARWLGPLLRAEVRSVFLMTEPEVASSDATNLRATALVEGDEVVLNGRKWWTTGLGHPDAKVGIFLGVSDPNAHRHLRHSMVLVPLDAPGVRIERMLPVFGEYDEPYGHGEVVLEDVRLPASAVIGGPGMGFAIAQGRLGPGRIHHCMRCIGAAERALELLIRRSLSREAFGKPLASLGGNRERIADLRMAIDQARLLVLHAAWRLDELGPLGAISDVSAIKVVAPNVLERVVDEAIQIHGGLGLSDDVPLVALHAMARVLRLADGPDAVHRGVVARAELARYRT
ncbi:MAG: acyl-CoA dehydrogenase family protein [Alphaproteobacteria bacterium]|nr:acyl-CoA dehydrogenase family protein [Alphaproteobacteria bacterium]